MKDEEQDRTIYIGDGVYASFDGFQVKVWKSNGLVESEPIYFEDETAIALIKYFKKVFGGA